MKNDNEKTLIRIFRNFEYYSIGTIYCLACGFENDNSYNAEIYVAVLNSKNEVIYKDYFNYYLGKSIVEVINFTSCKEANINSLENFISINCLEFIKTRVSMEYLFHELKKTDTHDRLLCNLDFKPSMNILCDIKALFPILNDIFNISRNKELKKVLQKIIDSYEYEKIKFIDKNK